MGKQLAWMIAVMALSLGGGVSSVEAYHQQASSAQGRDLVDDTLGHYHMHPAFDKLGRGITNGLMGWLEIPLTMQRRYETSTDKAGGLVTGLVGGTFKGITRTAVGIYETVTFWLPYYPKDFAPILPTLEYFEQPPTERRPPLR